MAIYRVAAAGGSPIEILTPNRGSGEVRVHWPSFLPDGKRFLYTARREDGDGELRLGTLDGPARTLMPVTSNAQWVDPDVVVFARDSVLMGQRIDVDAARPIGEPFSIAERVDYLFSASRAVFSASPTGTIAYHPHGDVSQMVWSDQQGNEIETIGEPAEYDPQSARLSSDGRMLLTARRPIGPGSIDIWRMDLERKTDERLTAGRGSEVTPILAADGRTLLFASDHRGYAPNLFRKDLVTGKEEPLFPTGIQQLLMDVIPGAQAIAYVQRSKEETYDIFRLALAAGASPEPILQSRLDKYEARVSPDGRAIAFAGIDGTRLDLYVASLPITSAPIVAAAGAWGPPRWSADGRRLYYVGANDRMMTIPVRTTPALTVGAPELLFQLKRRALLLDVARDGRFLLLVPQVRAGVQPIAVATAAIRGARP
jgi:Tol biopolymer transport system component